MQFRRDYAQRVSLSRRSNAASFSSLRLWLLNLGTAVCLSGVALGCSSNPGPATGSFQSASFDSLFIFIENQNFYDAAVFLEFQGGTRRRLSTVSAYSTERHAVRYNPSDMWFHVDFIGARIETRSRAMSLRPGETVQLELTANAHRTGQLITRRR